MVKIRPTLGDKNGQNAIIMDFRTSNWINYYSEASWNNLVTNSEGFNFLLFLKPVLEIIA